MAGKAKRHLGVVRFSAFGDVVFLHSVLAESADAGDRITLFTRPRWAERLPAHPQIEVHGLDVDRGPYAGFFGLLWFWWGWMRSADLTAWYDGHHHIRTRSSRFIAWLLRIPRGVVPKPRGARRALLRGGAGPVPNAYELHRAALAALAWPAIQPLPSLPRSGRVVLIAPHASRETKRWPLDQAAQLARQLEAEGYEPVFLGGPSDAAPEGFRAQLGSSPSEEDALLAIGFSADLVGRLTAAEQIALQSADMQMTNGTDDTELGQGMTKFCTGVRSMAAFIYTDMRCIVRTHACKL